jgi:hypothetical protein
MRAKTSARLAFASVLALAFALGACPGDDDTEAQDELAASHVAAALESGGVLARVVVPLEASVDLGGLNPDQARVAKILSARDSFRALNPLCVQVATDLLTYVDVQFDRCRILPLALGVTIDGSLRAELSVEPAGGLAGRLVVSVRIASLEVTGPRRSRRLSGEFQLRHTIPPQGAPVEFTGELQSADETGAAVAVSLGASWKVDNGCVTFNGGAHLEGDLLGALGPIALSGEQIQTCRNQCPTAGSVELAYGSGSLLVWTYTGADTVTLIGPRGKRVEVALACGGGG